MDRSSDSLLKAALEHPGFYLGALLAGSGAVFAFVIAAAMFRPTEPQSFAIAEDDARDAVASSPALASAGPSPFPVVGYFPSATPAASVSAAIGAPPVGHPEGDGSGPRPEAPSAEPSGRLARAPVPGAELAGASASPSIAAGDYVSAAAAAPSALGAGRAPLAARDAGRPRGASRGDDDEAAEPSRESARDAAPAAARGAADSAQRILASAGLSLSPFARGLGDAQLAGRGALFDPQTVTALGGRAGQGAVSMETNSQVTGANIDLSAKGFEPSMPPTDAGPRIPAGKAPPVPAREIPYIIRAAQANGIDPALLAATAARESNFRPDAYRAEPHLAPLQWRDGPGRPLEKYVDGSIGPMQVLRSNFKHFGIDNDPQAYDFANNYRVGARIIRSNLDAFPGDIRKAIAAYNLGQYGARMGHVPAGNYTDAILAWRQEYAKALARYTGK